MNVLRLRKTYADDSIDLVFTVDGVEQYRRSLKFPCEYAAKRIGIDPWTLQTMLMLLNAYAEWEIKDGEAIELVEHPNLHRGVW
jgi:hypothetical protein